MSHRKRDLRWRRNEYIPPDIENSVQLLHFIQECIIAYGQIILAVSSQSSYWTIKTPVARYTTKPLQMLTLVKHDLVNFYNTNSKEFLVQHALGTLDGQSITIGFINPAQTELELEKTTKRKQRRYRGKKK